MAWLSGAWAIAGKRPRQYRTRIPALPPARLAFSFIKENSCLLA